jgi:Fe-S-cluster containining protein
MVPLAAVYARMRTVWTGVAQRFSGYQLVLPGSEQFICRAEHCGAQCCRAFSVNLGQADAERFAQASGLQLAEFLECEDGKPIALPLAQPYLLARADGRCRQLGADLSCGQYEGRPNACRLYPHFIIFVDPVTAKPVYAEMEGMELSFSAALGSDTAGPYAALLLRHTDCPGFTGLPMSEPGWKQLFEDTHRLQYGAN